MEDSKMEFTKSKGFKKIASLFVAVVFLCNTILPNAAFAAEAFGLPGPAQFVNLSDAYSFPVLKGLKFDPANPLTMEFIIDNGNTKKVTKEEASRLVRYFLSGLTVPAENLWVNLSPYEKDRILPDILTSTELGEGLLSQDYILKQISASLTYPESQTGKDFWGKTYQEVLKIAKTTNIPVNTFNKIWIVPDKMVVHENQNLAVVAEASLKAMLEEDFLSLKNNVGAIQKERKDVQEPLISDINKASSGVMKEQILPKINADINKGKNFATLRQIYYSLILAGWFKNKFKESLYSNYIDKGKIKGIDVSDKAAREKVYNLYLQAFQKGLYNYIKPEQELATKKQIKRRYFSGGAILSQTNFPNITATTPQQQLGDLSLVGSTTDLRINLLSGTATTGTQTGPRTKEISYDSLTQLKLNFANLSAIESALKDIVEVTSNGIKITNVTALSNGLIDKLVYDATFNPNTDIVNKTRKLIKDIAASFGIKPASTYDLYIKKATDPRHYAIPAINIRGMAYNSARAVLHAAVRNKVTDPFIFEIARSEIGYTGQRPVEFTTSILAAAIKEGYNHPIYLQGDHFQITAKERDADLPKAIINLQKLIREAIEGGFYQIDLDMSTLVDWSKQTIPEQQKLNYKMTAEMTSYIRHLEKEFGLDKQGIVVNLGGEIGEIGTGLEKGKERNSSIEDLAAFMTGYNIVLQALSEKAGFQLLGITKVAVQSGTKHGGVRDAHGNVINAKVGFNTLAAIGKVARTEFGLAGVVQHGASTLPEDYFTIFAGNKIPKGLTIDPDLLNQDGQLTLDKHPLAEVHLATAYQDTILDSPYFPKDLRREMEEQIFKWYPIKESQDPKEAFVSNRKNVWGTFKLPTWNLPDYIQDAIRISLEKQFDAVFKNLGLAATSSSLSSEKSGGIGGINMESINVSALPSSGSSIILDPHIFDNVSFKITFLGEITDTAAFVGISPEKQEKKENVKLAYAR